MAQKAYKMSLGWTDDGWMDEVNGWMAKDLLSTVFIPFSLVIWFLALEVDGSLNGLFLFFGLGYVTRN
jgi:hypothetical protein